MAKLIWDAVGTHLYETGINQCALYVGDSKSKDGYAPGVAWSGITSVSESPEGAEANAFYADNIKYLNLISAEDLNGSIGCYTYPTDWQKCDGSTEIAAGIYLHQQTRKPFCLAYESIIGNDVDGDTFGKKLHVIYNALASPSESEYSTVNDSPEPNELSYDITTTPVPVKNAKPTSRITIESPALDDPDDFKVIEAILFGCDDVYTSGKTYAKGDVVEYTVTSDDPEPTSTTYVYKALEAVETAAAAPDSEKWKQVGMAGPRIILPDEFISMFAQG